MKFKKLLFLAILLLAYLFRFNNLNWDSNFHLQPDERFLTMIGLAAKIPTNLSNYFNSGVSSLNPSNIGFKFFVYGILPITFTKVVSIITNQQTYDQFTLLGRQLSAFSDVLVLIVVYKIVEIFEIKLKLNKSVKFWASFFYAVSVLPIQLSHFFTTDSFLNFFLLLSFYFSLRYWEKRRDKNLFLSAVFFALALATKLNAVFILPLNLYFILINSTKEKKWNFLIRNLVAYGLVSFITLFIADPYYFSQDFINSIKELVSFDNPNIWYPPGVQWIHKTPVLFSLINLAVFGVGIPYFIYIILGIIKIIKNFKLKIKNLTLPIILVWMALFFLYQSTVYVKTVRYFIFLYPFLAIFAAFGVVTLLKFFKDNFFIKVAIVISLLIWPVMFSSIYLHEHTRVTASKWIYQNLPDNSLILSESWDDALPLPVDNIYNKRFTIEALPVFDQDTQEKWEVMNLMLKTADYYVLSSNRGWGSIPTAPEKYPLMSKFYNDLLANKTPYKKIAEFTSYPQFKVFNFQFNFNDDWAEEAFTVYDHPKVMVFAKQKFVLLKTEGRTEK